MRDILEMIAEIAIEFLFDMIEFVFMFVLVLGAVLLTTYIIWRAML